MVLADGEQVEPGLVGEPRLFDGLPGALVRGGKRAGVRVGGDLGERHEADLEGGSLAGDGGGQRALLTVLCGRRSVSRRP
ncbi:hypothetical protein LUX57_23360 [Actinomadura madurae]|nr:hypothetical protein [Actinomadura madurae]MCP9967717.1 hypothetical protein [Actinomadura madurae]